MESKALVTSLSRSDLNSAFCDTSQSDKSSTDSLSFDSSGRDSTCLQSASTSVQTTNSNEAYSYTGTELSQSQVTLSPTKQSNSIYLDNGTDHHHAKPMSPKPQKTRLTMAERARLEAMASFGGAPLESVLKKHESFRDKLQKQKEALKAQCKQNITTETEPCTSKDCGTFKSSLSDLQVKKVDFKSRLKEEADKDKENTLVPPASKSRHQLAHEQSQSGFSFGDCVKHEGKDGLPSFRKKAQNTDANIGTEGSEPNVKRMTKVERSKMEVLQSFGADLQDLAVKPKIPKVLEEKLSLKRKLNNH